MKCVRPAKVALSSLKILPGSENLMGIGGERESLEEINICEERRYPAEEVKVENTYKWSRDN